MKQLKQYIQESLLDEEDKILNNELDLFNIATFDSARKLTISFLMDNNGKYIVPGSSYAKIKNTGLYTQTWNRQIGKYIHFAVLTDNSDGFEFMIHKSINHNKLFISDITLQDIYSWSYSKNNDEDGYFIYNSLTPTIEKFISDIFNKAQKHVSESLLDDDNTLINNEIDPIKWFKEGDILYVYDDPHPKNFRGDRIGFRDIGDTPIYTITVKEWKYNRLNSTDKHKVYDLYYKSNSKENNNSLMIFDESEIKDFVLYDGNYRVVSAFKEEIEKIRKKNLDYRYKELKELDEKTFKEQQDILDKRYEAALKDMYE